MHKLPPLRDDLDAIQYHAARKCWPIRDQLIAIGGVHMGVLVSGAVRPDARRGGEGLWGQTMTDVRESLANHLTAHGVPFEIGIRSTDVADLLEHMDWAMACGLIGPRYAGMLWAKYLQDHQEERKVRAWWLMECIEYGAAKGWRRPKARMVEGFAYATCNEHMGHETRCSVCNGTRQREVGQKIIECPACGGRGFVEYLPEVFAERIGCTMLEWDKTWRERVGWARRFLHRWELDAAEALRAKVGG